MADQLPHPLTPAECDLEGFEFMPVDIRRLLKSETWSLATGEERAAAVALWFESWHQVPAASLPTDDRLLKKLADADRWPKVKTQALRGWVQCNDQRLYHPVVAEKALEAWIERLMAAISGAAGNAKRWQITVDTDRDLGHLRHAVELLTNLAPRSRTLRKPGLLKLLAGKPNGSGGESGGDLGPESGGDIGGESGPDRNREGQREGEGEGTGLSVLTRTSGSSPSPAGDGVPPLLADVAPPGPATPACDHQAVLELWRTSMPANPQPVKWTDTRKRHLQARWRELFAEGKAHNRDEALAWFGKFFRYLAKSAFLTGRAAPTSPGRPAFLAELDWVLNPENFAKCIEGKYHPETKP